MSHDVSFNPARSLLLTAITASVIFCFGDFAGVAFAGTTGFANQAKGPNSSPGASAAFQLNGIVRQAGILTAFITSLPNLGKPEGFILVPLQREGDVQLLSIDEAAGKVSIRHNDREIKLAFAEPIDSVSSVERASAKAALPQDGSTVNFRLEKLKLDQVFALYQMLGERTLLRAPSLDTIELTLRSKGDVTATDCLSRIGAALAQRGIFLRMDGEKFVIAGRESDFAKITPGIRQVAEQLGSSAVPPEIIAASHPAGNIPAGFLDFRGVDLRDFLTIYQMLANRTVIPSEVAGLVTFRNYTPLTKTEALYAFGAALALNGVSVALAGEKFLLICRSAESNKMAYALAQKQTAILAASNDQIPSEKIDLRGEPLQKVAAIYERLCDCSVEADKDLPARRFTFRNTYPLTAQEGLTGLELLLRINGFSAVQLPGGRSVKFAPLPAL